MTGFPIIDGSFPLAISNDPMIFDRFIQSESNHSFATITSTLLILSAFSNRSRILLMIPFFLSATPNLLCRIDALGLNLIHRAACVLRNGARSNSSSADSLSRITCAYTLGACESHVEGIHITSNSVSVSTARLVITILASENPVPT